MKHGKKLNRKHKEFLNKIGLEPSEYLVERQTDKKYGFINKEIGKVEYFNLDGSRC